MIDYARRTATLKVLDDSDLLKLDKEDFSELLEEYPELCKGIMQILSQRLRSVLEKSQIQKSL